MKKFKIAICQNKPVRDKAHSVEKALEMVRQAASAKARLVVLPEIFYHPYELKSISKLAEKDHKTLETLAKTAAKEEIFLCTGSTAEEYEGKRYNSSFLISPSGEILVKHDKCHMFDVDFKDLRVKESSVFESGTSLETVETELGKIGILICYDIRFPEAARKLALSGAELIIVPAAFNNITGPAHWEVIFRARAIENQLYIAAASPARDEEALYKAYGHSMLISPWGDILAEAGEGEEIIYAELDPERLKEVRSRLPLLKHRRPEIY